MIISVNNFSLNWRNIASILLKKPCNFQAVGNEDTNDNFDVSDDDDTTIDQDLSSLQSEAVPSQSLPSWANHSRFLFISFPVFKTTLL